MRRHLLRLEDLACPQRLHRAWLRVRRGKGHRPDIQAYADDLDARLAALGRDLLGGGLKLDPGHCFLIREPKPRRIRVPPVAERILHHALAELMGPTLEARLGPRCCAGRIGLGLRSALQQARRHTVAGRWVLHLDVRHYFGSVPHAGLWRMLDRWFAGQAVLGLVVRLVEHAARTPGRGLAIGSLLSQQLANAYLAGLDRRIVADWGVRRYLRYMDDLALWGDDPAELIRLRAVIAAELAGLGLDLKPDSGPRPCADGFVFLGWRVTPRALMPSARSRRRWRGRLSAIGAGLRDGSISPAEAQHRATALTAWLRQGSCRSWRRRTLASMELGDA